MEEIERRWKWGPIAVMRHELGRSLTFWRIAAWVALAGFPVVLLWIAVGSIQSRIAGTSDVDVTFGFATLMFVLLPQVVTVLGLLLWATPVVHSELEGQTWVYAVVRPGGRRAVLIGKYIVAVLWTASATCVSTTLIMPIMGMLVTTYNLRLWFTLCSLNVIAAIAYAAVFVMIGTLIQRRAMATGFVFALIVEALLSLVPAMANQFTVSYRLRSLFVQWLDLPLENTDQVRPFFDMGTSPWIQLLGLTLYTSATLGIALWRVQASQFVWQSEV